MSKYLIIHIEIALAFDEDRPGSRVKIIDGHDYAKAQRLLEPQKGCGRHGESPFAQRIKKFDKQIRFLSAHSCYLLGCRCEIGALLEENSHMRRIPPGK